MVSLQRWSTETHFSGKYVFSKYSTTGHFWKKKRALRLKNGETSCINGRRSRSPIEFEATPQQYYFKQKWYLCFHIWTWRCYHEGCETAHYIASSFIANLNLERKSSRSFKPTLINPLSPNSDKHLISPYNIPTWSNRQVTRIKEIITKHKMSRFLCKFSQLVP